MIVILVSRFQSIRDRTERRFKTFALLIGRPTLREWAVSALLLLRFFAVFAALPVSLAAAQSAPPSAPAIDLSTPKSTIAALFAAVNDSDAVTLKRVFFSDTPQAAELTTANADLITATRQLREAAKLKFAPDGVNPAAAQDGTTPGKPPPEQAAQLAAATERIDGDRATVAIPDRPSPIQLRRVDGKWLIDMAEFAAVNPQQIGEQAELDHNLAGAMKEAADEITAGKYASAQEAESAVQQKIHAIIAPQLKLIATTTTAPTTSTAKQ